MSASRASIYEILELHKEVTDDQGEVIDIKKVSLVGKVVGFNYFESVYSHDVTANITFLDAGGSVQADSEQDKQERNTSIKSGLPIVGGEKLFFSIKGNLGTFNMGTIPLWFLNRMKKGLTGDLSGGLIDSAFNYAAGANDEFISGTTTERSMRDGFFRLQNLSTDGLVVNGSPIVAIEPNRQLVFLPLISNPAIKNAQSIKETKTYKGKISTNVEKMLKEVGIKKYAIHQTSNSYAFSTKSRGTLDLITELCRRSVPEKGDAGYFFYETKSGFHFKSISKLIRARSIATYTYTGVMQANEDDENNFRILRNPIVIRDVDFKKQKKWESIKFRSYDPLTGIYDEFIYNDDVEDNLGKKSKGYKNRNEFRPRNRSRNRFTRKDRFNKNKHGMEILSIKDIGEFDSGNLDPNNDPRGWQAQSIKRYNSLHSQILEIQVPCNLSLEAGRNIKIEFETQADDKNLGGIDEHKSGKYMILHLCHHFDTSRSFTSMTIARDSDGLYTGTNAEES